MGMQLVTTVNVVERPTSLYFAKPETLVKDLFKTIFWRRMRDLNPRKVALYTLSKRAHSAAMRILLAGSLPTG